MGKQIAIYNTTAIPLLKNSIQIKNYTECCNKISGAYLNKAVLREITLMGGCRPITSKSNWAKHLFND